MIEGTTAGLDWLTVTLPASALNEAEWYGKGLKTLLRISKEGYDIQERGLLGYKGLSCANCFIGARADGYMMQWCGRFAEYAYDEVIREDCHISRIDLQVTVQHDKMPLNVAGKGYRDAVNQNNTVRAGARRKIYIISGSDGGQTLYVGAKSSDQRGRLYNKEVQSEDPLYARTWRYEVVFTNDRAKGVYDLLRAATVSRPDLVSSIVAVWWEARGVEAPWVFDTKSPPLPPQKTLPTDVERQLRWITSQVAPTTRRLIIAGYRDTLLEALGFGTPDQA